MPAPISAGSTKIPHPWWSTRGYGLLLVLMAAIPLLCPAIPPITDLAGHMGRYRVELDLARSDYLRQWFDFRWGLVGNLGVDLLIVPMAKLFGLELGVKLIVLAIPPLAVAGMLTIAREVHGDVPASAAFALPLAYAAPFQFGFVNFALSMALAMLLFGLWLRLGRLGFYRLRIALFLVAAPVVWTIHAFGWGFLGLLVLVAACHEALRIDGWDARARHVLFACLPLAPPVLLFIDWSHMAPRGGKTLGFFLWHAKFAHMLSMLRNSDRVFDIASALLLHMMVVLGMAGLLFRFDRLLAAAAALLFGTFLLLPEIINGSSFAAMRLTPYVIAIALLGLVPKRFETAFALGGLLFFGARIVDHTIHYARLDKAWQGQLAALDHVPRGARIFAMAAVPCLGDWSARRMEHLGALGIVRREAFVNGQWTLNGAQLLTIHYPRAEGFTSDPTQILMPERCRQRQSYGLEEALAKLPRDAFDYIWLIDLPRDRWPRDPGLRLQWHGETGILLRIPRKAAS